MPKLKIIVVDKTRSPFIREGEKFYLNKLKRFMKVHWIEVKPVSIKKNLEENEVLKQEANSIFSKIEKKDYIISLDRKGVHYDSLSFANHIQSLLDSGKTLAFIIGGPIGLYDKLLNQSHELLSFGDFTFTHEIMRLLLLEQLYRTFTIINGLPYHK